MYFLINCAGHHYFILIGTHCIPNFLHDFDCLLDGDVLRISSLTNKYHVGCDKFMSESKWFNPVWKLLIGRFSGCCFTCLQRALSYELLEKYLDYCIK